MSRRASARAGNFETNRRPANFIPERRYFFYFFQYVGVRLPILTNCPYGRYVCSAGRYHGASAEVYCLSLFQLRFLLLVEATFSYHPRRYAALILVLIIPLSLSLSLSLSFLILPSLSPKRNETKRNETERCRR